MGERRDRAEIVGEFHGDDAHLARQRGADRRGPPVALATDELEDLPVRAKLIQVRAHRHARGLLGAMRGLPDVAEQPAEGEEGLVDQGQAQLVHVAEVAVEGGGHDLRHTCHLAQGEGAERMALGHQGESGVEQGPPCDQLAFTAQAHGVPVLSEAHPFTNCTLHVSVS